MQFAATTSILCIPLLLVFLSNALDAQTTTSGGLTGVITDQTNAVVANAELERQSGGDAD
jgi:hypothetical protein